MSNYKQEIIAEIGSVHDGSIGNACKLIKCAKDCGADIVKFQHHLAENEMTTRAEAPEHFKSENRFNYFKRINFSIDDFKKIIKECKKNKIKFLCSPFSEQSVKILEKLNVDAYKIASGELTNFPLLEILARTNKKIYLSTGMSNWNEIEKAVKIFKKNELIVMQCTSLYPTTPKNVGLNNIEIIRKKFKKVVGFSDHTDSFEAAISAAILGADVIEKHITFSKKMYGSDAQFAMELDDFKKYVKFIRNTWMIRNNPVDKNNLKKFEKTRRVFQKSIVLSRNLKKGNKIQSKDLAFKKPGDGLSPNLYKKLLNKKLLKDKLKDDQIKLTDIK